MITSASILLHGVLACASTPSGPVVLTGAEVVGQGPMEVRIEGDRITEVGTVSREGAEIVDVSGRFIVPAFADSHVHLAYLEQPEEMADGGVGAVVDWASPVGWLDETPGELERRATGPMITATGGYPTTSWGRDGYGAECTDGPSCIAAVDRHLARGATLVKLPITTGPQLDESVLRAVVDHAHSRNIKVGTHAMSDADVAKATRAGIDMLVHVPTATLTDETIAAWSGKVLIPTAAAFGASPTAIENTRRFREAGATVVYGTDFGNSRDPGIQRAELEALMAAGMDGAAILEAGTTTPAAVFGFELGIQPGSRASLLVLGDDPRTTPLTLAQPESVWVAGRQR